MSKARNQTVIQTLTYLQSRRLFSQRDEGRTQENCESQV